MPDFIDYSTEQYDGWLDNQIENIRRSASTRRYPPEGTCYNCDDPVMEGALYCNGECANDHHMRTKYA